MICSFLRCTLCYYFLFLIPMGQLQLFRGNLWRKNESLRIVFLPCKACKACKACKLECYDDSEYSEMLRRIRDLDLRV